MHAIRDPRYLCQLRRCWISCAKRYAPGPSPRPNGDGLPSESNVARAALDGILCRQMLAFGGTLPISDRRNVEAFLSELRQPGDGPTLESLARTIDLIHFTSELLERSASPYTAAPTLSTSRPPFLAVAALDVCNCLATLIAPQTAPPSSRDTPLLPSPFTVPVIPLQRELCRHWTAYLRLLDSILYVGHARVMSECPSIAALRLIATTLNRSMKPVPNPIARPVEFDVTLPAFLPFLCMTLQHFKTDHSEKLDALRVSCERDAGRIDPFETFIIPLDATCGASAARPIKGSALKILKILSKAKLSMTQVEIEDASFGTTQKISLRTIGRHLPALEAKGLVRRTTDRGGWEITDLGRAALAAS